MVKFSGEGTNMADKVKGDSKDIVGDPPKSKSGGTSYDCSFYCFFCNLKLINYLTSANSFLQTIKITVTIIKLY